MKNLLIILMLVSSIAAIAQDTKAQIRSIEVKGSSEIEIVPNEIFVGITLKEYKSGGKKVDLNKLEEELINALQKLRIDEDNLSVENLYGYNWNWKKRKPEDFLGSKSFILKVGDVKKMNELVDKLDPEGLNNINIRSYSHSDIETYRKEVKIGAMKAAKEKATYLLGSVGAKLGMLLQVQEVDYGYARPMMNMRSNMALESADASGYQSEVEFMKIKIRAEMQVAFEIE